MATRFPYKHSEPAETGDVWRRRGRLGVVNELAFPGGPVGHLADAILKLIADEKYVIGQHASERLEERGIMEWQAVAGVDDSELIAERPNASPNPAIELRERLPDGTEFKAVWSHLRNCGVAKLVTVHFFDRG